MYPGAADGDREAFLVNDAVPVRHISARLRGHGTSWWAADPFRRSIATAISGESHRAHVAQFCAPNDLKGMGREPAAEVGCSQRLLQPPRQGHNKDRPAGPPDDS
jgi:hypothetical protein